MGERGLENEREQMRDENETEREWAREREYERTANGKREWGIYTEREWSWHFNDKFNQTQYVTLFGLWIGFQFIHYAMTWDGSCQY